MDANTLIAVLTFGTLLGTTIFAYRSTQEIERRRQQKIARKSTLAADAPDTTPPGVKPADT